MLKGSILNGYTVLQDFKTAGSGNSKWSFVRKHEKEYFIKEFLQPTYPTKQSPGSASTKKRKLERCKEFEGHQNDLKSRLGNRSVSGGNLVITLEFFRVAAKYYKVTDKVDTNGLDITAVSRSTLKNRRLVMLTVAHSLRILHEGNVVHGDLKPDNILLKEAPKGYVAKLIDFDSSYIAGRPPTEEYVTGDQVYLSPEMLGYIKGDNDTPKSTLRTESDVFSLGLIYAEYLTGALPDYKRDLFRYPCEAVLEGVRLDIPDSGTPKDVRELVQSMLAVRPESRPRVSQVFADLKKWDPSSGRMRKPSKVKTPGKMDGTLLRRGKLKAKAAAASSGDVGGGDSEDRPKFPGTLGGTIPTLKK